MKKIDFKTSVNIKKKKDLSLLILTFLLTIFGLVMVYESSNVAAYQIFSDKNHFLKDQLVWSGIGFVLLAVFSQINYKKLYNFAIPLLIFSIFTLIIVLIPSIGLKALGARRWIQIGSFSFQPSEIAKFSLILYLSSWLTKKEKGKLLSFIILLGLIVGLVILQPDLGTAIILTSIFLIVYFLSMPPLWHFFILIPLAFSAVLILAVISPYRYQRLVTFLNPTQDPLGSSYHIRQVLISLGSGGLFGRGLGASRQKYQYLPEATTDSIFAIIAEEFGFVGSVFLLVIYLFYLYKILMIIKFAPDRFGFLLAVGIFSLFSAQILINLGAMVAIFPLTGLPLPFISYGGSNLIISLTSVGLLLNISRSSDKQKYHG